MITYANSPLFVQKLIDGVVQKEKGYVNNLKDRGGETKYGITRDTAVRNKYYGAMTELPLSLARDIYVNEYYYNVKYNLITSQSRKIAEEVMDSGVNVGTYMASLWLQESLNGLNNNQKHYKNILVDGKVGEKTQKALKSYLLLRGEEGEKVMLKLLNCLQGEYYLRITQQSQKEDQEEFLYGWVRARVEI